ncbi:hypothetical protein [Rubrivirga sp.]|uniref:hypothetical protein n=1 Tax=Rubrivirga sp. TaxID=1885344 RepID=UPI003B527E54
MRVALLLGAALVASAASSQPVSGLPASRPPTEAPSPPTTEPLQTSAAGAYLASAGATAGSLALGFALYHVLPASDPESDAPSPRAVGVAVMAGGALLGPSVGNLVLGAGTDVQRATRIKMAGLAAGAVIALGSTVVIAGCFGGSACAPTVETIVYVGAGVAAVGVVAGTVYDLATIPRNAALAQAHREGRRTVSLRPGGVGLALSVGL